MASAWKTIPTNRPMIRVDHPDVVFATKAEKEAAVVAEIRRAHALGQPVLAGTASVADSERLSALLEGVPHEVLQHARHDEHEAAIIARAGERGARRRLHATWRAAAPTSASATASWNRAAFT